MKILPSRSISQKIKQLILFISGGALLIASVAYITIDILSYRQNLIERVTVLSGFIATNATASIMFDDTMTAKTLLQSLTSEKTIIGAHLYKENGKLFSSYSTVQDLESDIHEEESAWRESVMLTGLRGYRDEGNGFDLLTPIKLDDKLIGYIQVEASFAILYQRLRNFLLIVLALWIVIMAAVYSISSRFQRRILSPINALLNGMIQVTREQDFSIRLSPGEQDEIGMITSGFNDMLSQIEVRDNKLTAYQDNLEDQVAQRTSSLLKARDAAEAGSRAKSEFLATMSHEIRTPMNGVLGMTELLLSSDLTERQHHFAKTIMRSGDSLMSIINDILDFSKIEAGKLELEHRDFNLRNLLEDTADILAERAHNKGLDLTPVLPLEPVLMVKSDENRLRQILVNLIGNAIKFTEAGEIVVRLIKLGEAGGQLKLCFEVSDTGMGMTSEQQSGIFDAFSQADSSTTRKFGGTGLGLAISYQLVSLFGGQLEVTSKPGKGTTFFFTLSLPVAEYVDESLEFTQELRAKRILIVDDNTTNREILHNQCVAWGMIDDCADNGLKALDMLHHAAHKGERYDLVLLDWHMPNMDGIELARRIHEDASIPSLGMVMLSSAAFDEEAFRAVEVGIHRYLNKPVRQKALFDCLTEVINSPVKQLDAGIQAIPTVVDAPRINANILLAEDNVINQEVARSMLEMLGCQVLVASDGQEAIDLALRNNIDLVLMDCHMPVKDGFLATREIRQQKKTDPGLKYKHLPIIALTANVQKGIQEECRTAGMDDYMSKPFGQVELLTILTQWLGLDDCDTNADITAETMLISDYVLPVEVNKGVLQRKPLDDLRAMQRPGRTDILNKVIKMYLKNTPDLLEAIHQSIKDESGNDLMNAAHSLKSSSANLGAMQVTELSKQLEALGKAGSMQAASHLLEQLDKEYEMVCLALSKELEAIVNA